MRKLINDPYAVVEESLEGLTLAYPRLIRKHPSVTAILRHDAPVAGKVAIVIGGGSGHEPLFPEYVGPGMADAAACGQVFAAPSAEIALEAIRAVHAGRGVLLLYNNYAGDCMNFDLAQEQAQAEGIEVETVLVTDEIASAPPGHEPDRRGTTADHVVIKVAGAAAEAGASLAEVVRVARKAVAGARSLGVALSSCTLPAVGKQIFDLPGGEMEIGMGLHGEPGLERIGLLTADETVARILPRIIEDLPYARGDRVVLVVNGYGATTRMELHIVCRKARAILAELGIEVHATDVGEFCTSMEMMGVSLTLVRLDEELAARFDAPCQSPAYSRR
jgi:phosphoenolpyruvate---glycerone phosphotransferase subunit DhaK